MTRDDLPTPGPNPPVPSWEEYDQLREAVEDYLGHQPDDPAWNDIWRALGAIMGEYQRDAFLEAFDVDERAENACVRRLISGEEECLHSPLEADDDPDGPPHAPPASDHATLWLDDGEPALYSMHVYPGTLSGLRRRSRRTTSGSTSSNSPRRGGWKSQSSRSRGTISARQYRSSSIHPSDTANHVLRLCGG